jgi:hypothetical protein
MAATLLYAAHSEGSGYTLISGSPTFTLAGGETLVVLMIGLSTADVGAPTDSAGTLAKQPAAYNAFLDSATTHGGYYTEANAAAGSHTITPPVIAGGSDGIVAVYKIDNMPPVLNVRAAVKNRQVSSSQSFGLTTDTSPQVGDIILGYRSHENSVPVTVAITRPSGWTNLFQYLNGALNLPTDGSYFYVISAGAQTGTWTTDDTHVTDTSGALLVLVPNASGAPAASYALSSDLYF